jgi:protein-arginine kinase activator protein McsA
MTIKVGDAYVEVNFCSTCAPDIQVEVSPIAINMVRCPRCGTSSQDLEARGFGCADDYEIFASGIAPGLEKYHGSSRHKGKIPRKDLFCA